MLKRFFKWLQSKLDKLDRNVLFKKEEIANFFKFITPRREKHILKFLMKTLKIGIAILFLIFYLPFVFHFISETQEFADIIIGYILKPINALVVSVVAFIPDLFSLIVIIFISKYLYIYIIIL